jgi:hypothetical protein
MQTIEGVVTIVQEGRFQVVDDRGVAHQMILGHAAAPEPEQLTALQGRQSRVRVACKDAPDLIGHVATRIDLMAEG